MFDGPLEPLQVIDAGYFPKLITPKPDGFSVAGVREVCSVSDCIAKGPDGWIQHWRHNWFGWFNTRDDAWSVVPSEARSEYRLFAYRLHPEFFRNGNAMTVTVPEDVRPEAVPSHFRRLGFDAASKTQPDVLGLECSPLSCNGLAQEIPVNVHCLIDSLADILGVAKRFSIEQPEPGDYYVVEVLEA